jgi:hypothetical protein
MEQTCTIYNWVESYNLKTDFGISLSDGAVSTLLAPAPAKERISNESRLESGRRIDIYTPTRFQARELTLEMHLIADTFEQFLNRWRAFLAAITATGQGIRLVYTVYGQSLTFDLQYLSATQFAAYNGQLGKFAVRFVERNPNNGQPQTNNLLGTTDEPTE